MRRPKYKLNEHIKTNDYEFQVGIEIQVFWNEHYVPDHLKEKLDDAKRYTKQPVYMCLVGTHWLPLRQDQIREDR